MIFRRKKKPQIIKEAEFQRGETISKEEKRFLLRRAEIGRRTRASLRSLAQGQPLEDSGREQEILEEIMGGGVRNQLFGTGQNLPTLHGNFMPSLRGEHDTLGLFGLD